MAPISTIVGWFLEITFIPPKYVCVCVQDLRDAVIVPVPKKGNLHLCDNWRGISLLDVVGKVLGHIIQD